MAMSVERAEFRGMRKTRLAVSVLSVYVGDAKRDGSNVSTWGMHHGDAKRGKFASNTTRGSRRVDEWT